MERDGANLHEVLHDAACHVDRPFSEPEVRRIMRQLLDTLRHVHAHRVMHRDIKRDILVYGNAVKMCDFRACDADVRCAAAREGGHAAVHDARACGEGGKASSIPKLRKGGARARRALPAQPAVSPSPLCPASPLVAGEGQVKVRRGAHDLVVAHPCPPPTTAASRAMAATVRALARFVVVPRW